jgi:N-acetylglucosamine-6-phosphate deacetylase
MILRCDRILTEEGFIDGWIEISDGRFVRVQRGEAPVQPDRDLRGSLILPGLIDVHLHGYHGWMDPTRPITVNDVQGFLKAMALAGTTGVMPSTDPSHYPVLADAYRQKSPGARFLGINLEAYFSCTAYSGFYGARGIFPQPTRETLQRLIEAAGGALKYVMIAPELESAMEGMRFLKANNIKVSVGHTLMHANDFKAFLASGCVDAFTHTANNMGQIHQRDVGVTGMALLDPNTYCEVISDFLHVSHEMLQLIFKTKAHDRIVLVSDSTYLSALEPADYAVPGNVLTITPNYQIVDREGNIHGDWFCLYRNTVELIRRGLLTPETAFNMASLNPARLMEIERDYGSIRVGKKADYLIADATYTLLETTIDGVAVTA